MSDCHDRGLGYVPGLDGLRGIAIALVVAYHARVLPGGFLGVDLFFVLSGFLITTLLLEEHEATGKIDLRAFYRRRFRRLFPALLGLGAVFAVLAIASRNRHALLDIIFTFGYIANIARAAGHHFSAPLTTMWSLGQEEQFYLLWPIILTLALTRTQLAVIGRVLVAAIALVVVWRAALVFADVRPERITFAPDTRFDPLLVGCLLALARARVSKIALLWPAAAALLIGDVIVSRGETRWTFLFGYTFMAWASALLVAAAVARRAPFLAYGPIVWLGRISYSLYLWHALAFSFVTALGWPRSAGIPLALVLAILSYRFVERPFRHPRPVTEPRPAGASA